MKAFHMRTIAWNIQLDIFDFCDLIYSKWPPIRQSPIPLPLPLHIITTDLNMTAQDGEEFAGLAAPYSDALVKGG